MLQVKARLKSPTKAQMLEELERLGWDYETNMTATGTQYRFHPTTSDDKKWWQFWKKKENTFLLPVVWLGERTIVIFLEPVYNLTLTLPYKQIEILKPNPYQLVMKFEDEVIGVFGKQGWVHPTELKNLSWAKGD